MLGRPYHIVRPEVEWCPLCDNHNPITVLIIEDNIDKIIWCHLANNPYAIHLLKKYIQDVENDGLEYICSNRNAIGLIEENISKLTYEMAYLFLNLNPNAISILEKYPNYRNYKWLSKNPKAIHLLEKKKNKKKLDWDLLSENPNAIHMLERNPTKINWQYLSWNENAIHLLEQNLDKVDWYNLSENDNAISILEKNLDKVDWRSFSMNLNAISILEKNLDKVDWDALCTNPNAVHIIEQHMEKVNWWYLSSNPNAIHLLAKLDYEKMKENMREFNEELVAHVFHPDRLMRFSIEYHIDFQTLNELY